MTRSSQVPQPCGACGVSGLLPVGGDHRIELIRVRHRQAGLSHRWRHECGHGADQVLRLDVQQGPAVEHIVAGKTADLGERWLIESQAATPGVARNSREAKLRAAIPATDDAGFAGIDRSQKTLPTDTRGLGYCADYARKIFRTVTGVADFSWGDTQKWHARGRRPRRIQIGWIWIAIASQVSARWSKNRTSRHAQPSSSCCTAVPATG